MAHYVIGDIHGCYDTLMALIKKIQFNPNVDTIYCVGDLVGRGPKPLDVGLVGQPRGICAAVGRTDLYGSCLL